MAVAVEAAATAETAVRVAGVYEAAATAVVWAGTMGGREAMVERATTAVWAAEAAAAGHTEQNQSLLRTERGRQFPTRQ